MTYLLILQKLISHRYTRFFVLITVIAFVLARPLYVRAQPAIGVLAQIGQLAQNTPSPEEEQPTPENEEEDEEEAQPTPTAIEEPADETPVADQSNLEPTAESAGGDTESEPEGEVEEAAAGDAPQGESYSLPYVWQGDATISASELATVAPPLQAEVLQGDFQVAYVPAESGDILRLLPVSSADGLSAIRIFMRLDENSADPALPVDQVAAVNLSARVYAPENTSRLVIADDNGSSSVALEGLNWSDYQVTRQIAADATWLEVILEWSDVPASGWLELQGLTLTIASHDAVAELSPTDTPEAEAAAVPSTPTPTATVRIIPTATPLPDSFSAPAATVRVIPTATPLPDSMAAPSAGAVAQAAAVPASGLVVVTSTPTPANVFEEATRIAQATEWAGVLGASTPTPPNMATATPTITPIIVTNTPVPANAATATQMALFATAVAFTTGTPTPVPPNAVVLVATPTVPKPTNTARATNTPRPTATPTPLFVYLDDIPVAEPSVTPNVPPALYGKIVFLSSYRGNPRSPNAMMINPDGTGAALLTTNFFYNVAAARDAYSADSRFHVYSLREGGGEAHNAGLVQLFYDDALYSSTQHQLTYFGAGVAWAPAWSPTGETIAYVSSETRNDEIWVSQRNQWPPMQLTKNDWEWDHHPSFSPDGSEIVFTSNRETGRRQLWLMTSSGGDQRQLTNFAFEAWDPVWVKYVGEPSSEPSPDTSEDSSTETIICDPNDGTSCKPVE